MLPKLKLAGLAEREPCVPVPVRLTVSVGFDAPLVTVMLPLEFPVVAGAN